MWTRLFLFFKIFLMFIYFWERERETVQVEQGQRTGDTEYEAGSRLWGVSTESDVGLKPMSREIMTCTEVGHSTDWATQVLLNFQST